MSAGDEPDPELGRLGRGLVRDPTGIWRPRVQQVRPLSFPAGGNAACFQIEDDSFWFSHRNACIAAALRRARFDGPLLDIGGGNGAVSHALRRNHIATVLLEPGVQGADNARRRGLPHVICATLEEAGFEDGAFGAAGLFDVVEHVADDDGLLREVHRIIRPGGTVCITVPAYRWLWSAEDELAGHHRRYTLPGLRAVLSRSSFEVRYQTYFFAPLVAPILVLRSLRHRLRRRPPEAVEQAAAGQHVPPPVLRRAMQVLLSPELRRIRAGKAVSFGTSCLVVAERR